LQRTRAYLVRLSVIIGSLCPTMLRAEAASLPKVWNGEIIERDQGLVSLHAVIIDSMMKTRVGDFSFLIRGRKHKTLYSFAAQTQNPKTLPSRYWRIREDTYDLIEMSLQDEQARPRRWQGPYSKPLIVMPQTWASLGVWYILAAKEGPIKVLIKPQHQKVPLERWKGSVLASTDALTGKVLQSYKAASETNSSTPALRQVLRGSRSIQMLYEIHSHDPEIRTCYTDLLDRSNEAEGELIYSFVYSGIDQGIKSLKIKRSTLIDPEFQECLYYTLRGLTFPLRTSLAGELSFQFHLVKGKE
jgi:hypothetical protein